MEAQAVGVLGRRTKTSKVAQFRCVPNRLWQDSTELVIEVNVKSVVGDSAIIGTWDRVLLALWRGEATSEAAQNLLRIGRELVAARGAHQLNYLAIIESRSPPPSDKVRKELSAAFREFAPAMKHQIFVGEGSGFRAALVRGVGLAVSTLAPSLLPFKFAGSLDEAAMTIAPGLSPAAGGAEGLKAAVAQLRKRLDEPPPAKPGFRA